MALSVSPTAVEWRRGTLRQNCETRRVRLRSRRSLPGGVARHTPSFLHTFISTSILSHAWSCQPEVCALRALAMLKPCSSGLWAKLDRLKQAIEAAAKNAIIGCDISKYYSNNVDGLLCFFKLSK